MFISISIVDSQLGQIIASQMVKNISFEMLTYCSTLHTAAKKIGLDLCRWGLRVKYFLLEVKQNY